MREYVLGVDQFNMPKCVDNNDAVYLELIRLIMLEKNTYTTHPDMGVGIVSRYRYSFTTDIEILKTDIENQIATYLPQLIPVDVLVTQTDQVTTIRITVNGVLYELIFDKITKTFQDLI